MFRANVVAATKGGDNGVIVGDRTEYLAIGMRTTSWGNKHVYFDDVTIEEIPDIEGTGTFGFEGTATYNSIGVQGMSGGWELKEVTGRDGNPTRASVFGPIGETSLSNNRRLCPVFDSVSNGDNTIARRAKVENGKYYKVSFWYYINGTAAGTANLEIYLTVKTQVNGGDDINRRILQTTGAVEPFVMTETGVWKRAVYLFRANVVAATKGGDNGVKVGDRTEYLAFCMNSTSWGNKHVYFDDVTIEEYPPAGTGEFIKYTFDNLTDNSISTSYVLSKWGPGDSSLATLALNTDAQFTENEGGKSLKVEWEQNSTQASSNAPARLRYTNDDSANLYSGSGRDTPGEGIRFWIKSDQAIVIQATLQAGSTGLLSIPVLVPANQGTVVYIPWSTFSNGHKLSQAGNPGFRILTEGSGTFYIDNLGVYYLPQPITYNLNGGEWADGFEPPVEYTAGTAAPLPDYDKVTREVMFLQAGIIMKALKVRLYQ